MEQLITWHKSFSVGSEKIDDQHKIWIDLINQFYDAFKEKKTSEILDEVFTKLKDYTILHFNTEAELFKKYNYPETEVHLEQHKLFIAKLAELETKYLKNNVSLSTEMMIFLKNWLMNHILVTDMKYKDFFKQYNL
jgi:hemerythrin-like metal-binding protein